MRLLATAALLGFLPRLGLLGHALAHFGFLCQACGFFATLPFSLLLNVWLGTAYYDSVWPHLLACLATLWLWRRPPRPSKPTAPAPMVTRRGLLLGAGAVAWGLGYGNRVERFDLQLTYRDVPLTGLPASLDGLKIVLMSDWHCGPSNRPAYLARAMALANREQPDLVALTGDFVDYCPVYFAEVAELAAQLRTRIPPGVLGVLGNHDHWAGAGPPSRREGGGWGNPALEQLGAAGIQLMDNRALRLSAARNWESDWQGSGLCLAGLGDLWSDKILIPETLGPVPAGIPRLVLAHNPDTAEHYPQAHIDLMLSGHTHGGQVRFPLVGAPILPSKFGKKYSQGWVQGPGYPVYVTRGLGVTDIPVRFGAPPEITVLRLRARA